ncbi:MAG: hypothetical protein QM820_61110 [Minicystis sp.]
MRSYCVVIRQRVPTESESAASSTKKSMSVRFSPMRVVRPARVTRSK